MVSKYDGRHLVVIADSNAMIENGSFAPHTLPTRLDSNNTELIWGSDPVPGPVVTRADCHP